MVEDSCSLLGGQETEQWTAAEGKGQRSICRKQNYTAMPTHATPEEFPNLLGSPQANQVDIMKLTNHNSQGLTLNVIP